MPKRAANRERLAQHLESRRVDLGLTWAEVAEAADLTTETLRVIRTGNSAIRPLTRRGLERAMRWEGGSVAAILSGGEPTPLPELRVEEVAPPPGALPDERMLVALWGELPDDKRAELWEIGRMYLRRAKDER